MHLCDIETSNYYVIVLCIIVDAEQGIARATYSPKGTWVLIPYLCKKNGLNALYL